MKAKRITVPRLEDYSEYTTERAKLTALEAKPGSTREAEAMREHLRLQVVPPLAKRASATVAKEFKAVALEALGLWEALAVLDKELHRISGELDGQGLLDTSAVPNLMFAVADDEDGNGLLAEVRRRFAEVGYI